MMRRRVGSLVTAVWCVCAAHPQLAPEESLSRLRTADGIAVTLFAAEPDLVNPTTIDVDAQGRVWVTEAANYRLFNQPETRPAGDRIRVLEDTNGDGVCDKATTFYQDPTLQAPMGIAVLGDRVYVCQAPDLFYLRDTDGDGVADEKTVILTGFEGVDHDHAIHGVMFGPDGYLYMSAGDRGLDVTDKEGNRVRVGKDRPFLAASVLRTDLEGQRLELLAHGMRNPYEPAVDSFGNVFISDNDDDGNENCRINYVMEGGNYGYWPKRKGDRRLDAVHWNEDLPGIVPKMVRTGFGSPCGMMAYEHGLLPERFAGALLHADAGPGVVRAYPYREDGAGFASEIDTLLRAEGDTWFRPVDVCAAPDGSIVVADWYDPGVGGHRMGDAERGRIYRLAPAGASYNSVPLDLESDAGLTAALTSPNQARRFMAFQQLASRAEKGDLRAVKQLYKEGNTHARSRALWMFARGGKAGRRALQDAAKDDDAYIRAQAVRAMADLDIELLRESDRLVQDPSPHVRRQVLIELARADGESRADWMDNWIIDLAAQHDGQDRFYREAIGIACAGREEWAFAALERRIGETWNPVFGDLVIQLHPATALARAREAAEAAVLTAESRMLALKALDAIGTAEAGRIIAAQLRASAPSEVKQYALHLLSRDGGGVWKDAMREVNIEQYLARAIDQPEMSGAVLAFAADTELVSFVPQLIGELDNSASDPTRQSELLVALERLAHGVNRSDRGTLLKAAAALSSNENDVVWKHALSVIAAVRGNDGLNKLGDIIIDVDKTQAVRQEAAALLARSESGSILLLNIVERGELPTDLQLAVSDRLHRSPHEEVRLMAASLLPREMTREGDTLPAMDELIAMSGDASRGREAFFSVDAADCARCHVVNDEGKLVGPDLSVIGQKLGRDALLESILNPSAAVAHEYKVWIFETENEGFLTGFIRSESAEQIELIDAAGNVTNIAANDVLDRRESATSLMPDGLSAALTAQELVDIVAFLETLK